MNHYIKYRLLLLVTNGYKRNEGKLTRIINDADRLYIVYLSITGTVYYER